VGKQFLNTRRGDRFFFERENSGGFSRGKFIVFIETTAF